MIRQEQCVAEPGIFGVRFMEAKPIRKRIYISGPITLGDQAGNVSKAIHVGKELFDYGYAPHIPHLNWFVENNHFAGMRHEDWMQYDLPWVAASDAVLRLPGKSKGADEECEFAKARKIPVYDTIGTLLADLPPKSPEKNTETETPLGDPRFHAALTEMAALHAKKQRDYGRGNDPFANLRASIDWGIKPWVGALIRLNDKIGRLKSYLVNGSLANEGVEDSLLDMAVYAVIALVLFREQKGENK